jgi:hypothetical protein
MPRGSSLCFVVVHDVVETLIKVLLYSPFLFNFIMILQPSVASIL